MNLKKYIPTYEDCIMMCNTIESPFYETKIEIDKYKVSIFNYRLAQHNDFLQPLKDNSDKDALELRGITFIFNDDGSLFKRYILLEKFFNLNQVSTSMYSIVKNYKIKNINNKEDGSLVTFIKLPNGKVLGKTKMSFDNDQSKEINKIYNDNLYIKNFVDWSLNNDYIPIFEYVSPQNRIVIKYQNDELILLKVRNNKNGKYIDFEEIKDKICNIKIAEFENNNTLDNLIELSKTQINKEGWVVQFDNDIMIKIKTEWYRNLHSIYTNDLYHEDKLIRYILDENIDDIICELKDDEHLRKRVDNIISIIKKCIFEKINRINNLYNKYTKIGTIKEFAIIYSNNVDFSDTIKYIRNNELSLEEISKDWVRRETNRLEKARKFIECNKTNQ